MRLDQYVVRRELGHDGGVGDAGFDALVDWEVHGVEQGGLADEDEIMILGEIIEERRNLRRHWMSMRSASSMMGATILPWWLRSKACWIRRRSQETGPPSISSLNDSEGILITAVPTLNFSGQEAVAVQIRSWKGLGSGGSYGCRDPEEAQKVVGQTLEDQAKFNDGFEVVKVNSGIRSWRQIKPG